MNRWRTHVPVAEQLIGDERAVENARDEFLSQHRDRDFESAFEQMYDFEEFLNDYDIYGDLGLTSLTANGFFGQIFQSILVRELPGAETEVYYNTPYGGRRVDIVTEDGVLIETKVGRINNRSRFQRQALADSYIVNSDPDIYAAEWHFAVSPRTGLGGHRQHLEHSWRIMVLQLWNMMRLRSVFFLLSDP